MSTLRRALLLAWFVACASGMEFFGSFAVGDEPSNRVADGALYSCVMLDLDRAIAVGDRELILRTEDGGKSWKGMTARGPSSYFAIGFDVPASLGDAPRAGVIVGGRIDSATGRSQGVVELTKDDGKTWTRCATVGLPRLLGLQRIKHRHWIAWGDWSDHWQSSLFETTDGGRTWSARPTPSGHLRSAALDSAGRTLVLDRSGVVYFSQDGLEYTTVSLEIDPFRPLRFCRASEEGWWMGGDHGQLFHSSDGLRWTRISLPGNARDHELIQLKDAAARGSRIWLVGEPGSVVWHSEDLGRHWSISTAKGFTGLNSLHALDDDVLLACGEFGRIQLSRNRGIAWIDSHHSGARVACQAIAPTASRLPWDALAYVTHESQRRSSALVIHQQDLQGASAQRPEWSERFVEAGRQMGLERTRLLTEFPVGDLRTGIRSTDLGYYQSNDANQSELVRRLVFEIRCARPDLIVAEDTQSRGSLEAAAAIATQQAIRLAASPSFQCFSPESGMTIPEWNVQRVLHYGNDSGGLAFAPTMLLNSSNLLLSEALFPVRFLEGQQGIDSLPMPTKHSYRMSTQRTVSIKHPLDGMILDHDTRLIERKKVNRKMANLMAASNAESKASQLFATRGSGVWAENAWDDSLNEFAKEIPNEILLPILRDLAMESRRAGSWHRWNSALNLIIERDGQGPMAELAYRELMTYFGSAEVHRIVQDQWLAVEAVRKDASKSTTLAATSQSSPFATGNPVTQASFENTSRLTPMARLRGTAVFSRLISRWPESWQAHRSEPDWAWLIASRYRSRAILRGAPIEEIKDNLYWPPKHPALSGWSQILEQEQRVATAQGSSSSGSRIPWVTSRPFLDGKDDESCWSQCNTLELASPWSDSNNSTRIRIGRDADFLFIHSRSRKQSAIPGSNPRAKPAPVPNAQRRRDGLESDKDHIRFRLDLDRDYSTWFEFGWDIDGETLDQCNDMAWWNPEWYIAVEQNREFWCAEIAIPLASLLPDPSVEIAPSTRAVPVTTADGAEQRDRDVEAIDWGEQTWAFSLVREIPFTALQSIPMCEADRWSRDRWILGFPQRARSSQPEPPTHLANPAPAFLGTKR